MKINIFPRQITKLLICVVLALTIIHCVFEFIKYGLGYSEISHIGSIFDFEYDSNLTTWYSSITLLACSLLLAIIAIAKKQDQDSYSFHWKMLAIIFAVMSLDEVAMLHERAGNLIDILSPVEYTGWLNYQWVLLGIPLTAIIAIAYLRFIVHLPTKTRNLFILAGALFVGGALGLEILAGYQESLNTSSDFLYELFTTIEELWEKLGVLVFIHALLTYIEKYISTVQIALGNNSSLSQQADLSQVRDREYSAK